MNNHNLKKVLSIVIGLILAAVLLFFGFSIVQNRFGKASSTIRQASFVVTETTDNSFTIGFLADDANLSPQIEYGTECTEAGLSLFALCSAQDTTADGTKYTCPATLLTPDTTYYWDARVGDEIVRNGETCFNLKTKAKGASADGVANLTPTAPQLLRPTAAPTVAPTLVITPASSISDCSVIQRGIGTMYTAFDYSACQSRNASLTPTAAAN